MIKTRLLKILRDVQKRTMQTVLVAASIFIGVFGVVTLTSMGEIVVEGLTGTIQQDRLPMIRAYLDRQSADDPASDFLPALNALPDIERVEAINHVPVYWRLPTGSPDEEIFTEGRIFGYSEPFDAIQIEPIELVSGRWPVLGQQELAVERRFAAKHGVQAGDSITLRILSSAAGFDGVHEETWTIVGTVFEPYQYPVLPGAPTSLPAETMLFAAVDDVNYISGLAGYNLLQARYRDFPTAEARAVDFKAAVAAQTPYIVSLSLIEDPAHNNLIEQTNIMRNVLTLLAVVALVVAGFLVLNIINATVIEQRRQIGIMKSLGATGWDNFVMYAGIALIYGIIGVVPGVLLGIPAGFAGSEQIAPLFNIFLDGFSYSPMAIVVGIVLGLFVPVAAAALPVILGIRITILQAITDLGIQSRYRPGPLARVLDLFNLPINLRQSLRNVLHKKGRLTLTVITLALASGAFMGIYAALASMTAILDNSLGRLTVHISVSPNNGAYDYATVRDLIADNVDGIRAIEPSTILAVDIEGYQQQQVGPGPTFLIVSGINPANSLNLYYKLRAGEGWRSDPTRHGVVISDPIAHGLGAQVGDTLTLRVSGNRATVPIIGIAAYSFESMWMRWDDLSALGGLVSGAPVPNQYVTELDVNGAPVPALGMSAAAAPFLTFTAGEFFNPDEPGVIISTPLAEQAGYAVGDQLTLASHDGEPITLPVTGIFDIPPELVPEGQSTAGIALDWRALAALEGRSLEGDPQPGALQVFLDEAHPDADFVSDKIAEINEVLLANGINSTYTNWVASVEGVTLLIRTAGVVLNIAAALIAAVGAIGLLSTLSMSVFERQKEIGVMRSVGATSYTIAFQFLIEGGVVGLVAWALGIPFSYLLDQNLVSQFNIDNTPEAAFAPIALVLGLVGTVSIALIASLWPSVSAARKTIAAILRYQ